MVLKVVVNVITTMPWAGGLGLSYKAPDKLVAVQLIRLV